MKFWGSTLRHLSGPTLRAPHPSGPPPFGAHFFWVWGSSSFGAKRIGPSWIGQNWFWPKLAGPKPSWPKMDWPKLDWPSLFLPTSRHSWQGLQMVSMPQWFAPTTVCRRVRRRKVESDPKISCVRQWRSPFSGSMRGNPTFRTPSPEAIQLKSAGWQV